MLPGMYLSIVRNFCKLFTASQRVLLNVLQSCLCTESQRYECGIIAAVQRDHLVRLSTSSIHMR